MKYQVVSVSLEQAATPRDGEVLTNRWWGYVPDEGILFAIFPGRPEHWAPQCNSVKKIAEAVTLKIHPDAELLHVPVVFLGHRGNCT